MITTTTATPATTDTTKSGTKQAFELVAPYLLRAKPSMVYYANKKHKGKLFRESLKTTDREHANRLLKDWLNRLDNTHPSEESNMLFPILAGQWLESKKNTVETSSYERYQGTIAKLNKHFGNMKVKDITTSIVNDWKNKRSGETKGKDNPKPISSRTVNMELTDLKGIMNLAVIKRIISVNPVNGIKKISKNDKRQDYYPTKSEVEKLLAQIRTQKDGKQSAILFELLAHSGMRLGVATNLKWGDVHIDATTPEKSYYVVIGGKRKAKNERNTLPMSPTLRQFFINLKASLPTPPNDNDPVSPIKNARKAIANACREIGLPHVNNHALRHYFVSECLQAGIRPQIIAKLIEHKDGGLLVAKVYGHVHKDNLFDEIQKVSC